MIGELRSLNVDAKCIENWDQCPAGSGHSIEGGPIEIDGRYAWQQVECADCGMAYTEVYEAHHRVYEVVTHK